MVTTSMRRVFPFFWSPGTLLAASATGGPGAQRPARTQHLVGQLAAAERPRQPEPAIHQCNQGQRQLAARDRTSLRQMLGNAFGRGLDLCAKDLTMLGGLRRDLTDHDWKRTAF